MDLGKVLPLNEVAAFRDESQDFDNLSRDATPEHDINSFIGWTIVTFCDWPR
jgi:hypothetical protein